MKPRNIIAYNALKLIASSVLGQAVALLLLMIVGRQYNEEMMGVLGTFLSWGGVLAIIATGRYEQAIVIAPSNQEAFGLYLLGIRLTILFSLFTLSVAGGIYLLFPHQALGGYVLLLPLFVLTTSFYALVASVALREKSFNRLSLSQSINGVGNNLLKVIWGSFHPSVGGLIFSSIGATFLALPPYTPFIKKIYHRGFSSLSKTLSLGIKYRNFPCYSLPQSLVNTLLGVVLVLFLPWRFGVAEVGFLTMATMLARRPLNLISENIGRVYFQQMSEKVQQQVPIAPLVRRLTLLTFGVGIPLALLLAWSMDYFVLFFVGHKWLTSAHIIRCMLPMLLPNFLSSILNVIPDILGFQRSNMWSQIILLLLYTTIILVGFQFFDFEEFTLFFFGCTALTQVGYLLYLFRLVILYERNIQK